MSSISNFKQTEIGTIPTDWEVSTLKDICAKKGGVQTGPFGSQLHKKDYKETGTPIITVEHLGENRIIHHNLPFVSDEDCQRLFRYSLKEGDIVFSRVGSVDRRAYVTKKEDGWLFSGRCLRVRPDPKIVNSSYLSWFFGYHIFTDYIRRIAVGATMPSLNTKLLENVPIIFPPLEEQNFIASILNSLNDKIELNRRMNATLEQIAQAIFKQWFIDFEFPDENGQPYKSSGGEMVESELGEIPRGWNVGKLKDICEINMGQSPPGKTYNENGEGTPFYQGITDFGFRFPTRRIYCTEPKKFAEKNDVLLSVRAPVGSLNISNERCAIGRGLAALKLKETHGSFLYYLLLSTKHRWSIFESGGTVFSSINKSNISEFELMLPPDDLISKFNNLILSKEELIFYNTVQNNSLSQIRDSLLPKLMSGKIRILV